MCGDKLIRAVDKKKYTIKENIARCAGLNLNSNPLMTV